MRSRFNLLFGVVLVMSFASTSAQGQCRFGFEAEVDTSDDGVVGFGFSVAIDGDVAAIGGILGGVDDEGLCRGIVSVFRRDRRTLAWEEEQVLCEHQGIDWFGVSVSLDGDVLVVAAFNPNTPIVLGAFYVYRYHPGFREWQLEFKESGFFGPFAVSISGDVIVVGEEFRGDFAICNYGWAHVYRYDGNTWLFEQSLRASDRQADAFFGHSVAVDGDDLVIGAWRHDEVGIDSGAAYAFHFDGFVWTDETKLVPGDLNGGEALGGSVSISDGIILIGAEGDNGLIGSAYTFEKSGGTWVEQQKLSASDGATGDFFGAAVHMSGPWAIIGSVLADIDERVDSGAAYIYRLSDGQWNQVQKLVQLDAMGFETFGHWVGIDPCGAIVGAPLDNPGNGSASLYRFQGGWGDRKELRSVNSTDDDLFGFAVALHHRPLEPKVTAIGIPGDDSQTPEGGAVLVIHDNQRFHLAPPGATPGERFGASLALSADFSIPRARGVSGAPIGDGNTVDTGTAYVLDFDAINDQWSVGQELAPTDGAAHDLFGFSVALDGDVVAVGAPLHDMAGASAGAVYVYRDDGTGFYLEQKITASNAAVGDQFGDALSIRGRWLFVGAPRADVGPLIDAGSVYVFQLQGGSWVETQILFPAAPSAFACFGDGLALENDRAAIGAPSELAGGLPSGVAYLFRFLPGTGLWLQRQRIANPFPSGADAFGAALALCGDTLAIGAPNDAQTGSGSVTLVSVDGAGSFTLHQVHSGSVPTSEGFGTAVALSGQVALSGSPGFDDIGVDRGRAFTFTTTPRLGLDVEPVEGGIAHGVGATVRICGGIPFGAFNVNIVEHNGNRLTTRLASGTFDELGDYESIVPIPPSLEGRLMIQATQPSPRFGFDVSHEVLLILP